MAIKTGPRLVRWARLAPPAMGIDPAAAAEVTIDLLK